MRKNSRLYLTLVFSAVFLIGLAAFMESYAWARAGGGGSSGSRGSRSFSSPSMPSRPSSPSTPGPSPSSPGSSPSSSPGLRTPGSTPPSSGGWFSRSPFLQGMAGGLAGGLIGNMLFGGSGHAASGGGSSAGGIGLIDILIIGVGIYFLMKYLKRRRLQAAEGTSYYGGAESAPYAPQQQQSPYFGGYEQGASPQYEELQRGLQDIARYDPGFNEETFKETAQDLFFRIQAGWMNRSVEGIDNLLTSEMAQFFNGEFAGMKQQGRINRLENIAVRKVEPSEAWQEAGKDYITVLFTANLLDYTVDDKTGQVVGGDKLNPVKFEEFWTFVRDVGTSQWKLSAINQTNQSSGRIN